MILSPLPRGDLEQGNLTRALGSVAGIAAIRLVTSSVSQGPSCEYASLYVFVVSLLIVNRSDLFPHVWWRKTAVCCVTRMGASC